MVFCFSVSSGLDYHSENISIVALLPSVGINIAVSGCQPISLVLRHIKSQLPSLPVVKCLYYYYRVTYLLSRVTGTMVRSSYVESPVFCTIQRAVPRMRLKFAPAAISSASAQSPSSGSYCLSPLLRRPSLLLAVFSHPVPWSHLYKAATA